MSHRSITKLSVVFILLMVASGCSYTVHMNPQPVINTVSPQSNEGFPLEVDIACLTCKDLDPQNMLSLVSCTNEQWFDLKDKGKLKHSLEGRFYTFCDKEYYQEKWGGDRVGDYLRGASHDEAGPAPVTVKHPVPFNEDSAIIIFARWANADALRSAPSVVLRPPCDQKKHLFVEVGKTSMTLTGQSNRVEGPSE
jgi:hypothetical protein